MRRNITDKEAMEDKDYERARASLKIFPIGGSTVGEMMENLLDFMRKVLELLVSACTKENIVSIRRLGHTRFAPNEILVVFADAMTRDSVIGSSSNLAGMVDKAKGNAPTAGIRTVVPNHLRSIEKQLSDYERRLRGKHGKGTKTHIKFDNGDRTIYLNVRLKDDSSWSRVYPEFARNWLKQLKNSDAEELNKKFNLQPTKGRASDPDGAKSWTEDLHRGAKPNRLAGTGTRARTRATKSRTRAGSTKRSN